MKGVCVRVTVQFGERRDENMMGLSDRKVLDIAGHGSFMSGRAVTTTSIPVVTSLEVQLIS